MKILVYAFKPFGQGQSNISQIVLKRLRARKRIRKVVFPVEFNSSIFIKAVQDIKPDVILGLGQYPRGEKVRIERRAKNRRRSRKEASAKIARNGQSSVPVTLRLQPDENSWVSYNAGAYVCNYSMYVLITSALAKKIPYTFLHIPKNIDSAKATGFVEAKIDEILAGIQKS